MAERLSPDSVRSQLESELLKLIPLRRRLPRRINKLSESLEQGRLLLNIRISLYSVIGYCLLFVGCVLALRLLVLIFRRSWSP